MRFHLAENNILPQISQTNADFFLRISASSADNIPLNENHIPLTIVFLHPNLIPKEMIFLTVTTSHGQTSNPLQ